MLLIDLIKELDTFKDMGTVQSWKKSDAISYSNEYIKVLRIDSSNRAGGSSVRQGKMWSIIVDVKKDFMALPHWIDLCKHYGKDLNFTPVKTGQLTGYFGIRFYNMSKDPTEKIVVKILDYIFK